MPLSLTLKPAQTEITLLPGATYTQAYDITNNSTTSLLLSASLSPWLPADNSGAVTYLDSSQCPLNFSLSNADLKLNQNFLLSPRQKKQLVLKITNPSNLETDCYYTFFLTQKPLEGQTTSGQSLAQIGSHLLISTSSTPSLSRLEISRFSLSPSFRDIFTTLTFNGEIYNPDSHFNQIDGQITLSHAGKTLWQSTLFPHTVAAKSSRLLHCLSTTNEVTPCRLSPPLWPGYYQGTITLNGPSSQYQYHFQFFLFPYSLLLFILFLFSLLVFLLKHKQSSSSKS